MSGQNRPVRDLPDPARLRDLNNQRHLPNDHPSKGKFPIFTSAVQARQRLAYVRRTGVVPLIDELLRSHPGPRSVLTTEAFLTSALLAAETGSVYTRAAQCSVLAGLDSAVAIEWGLCDLDAGREPVSYKVVCKQASRLETLIQQGAVTDNGTRIDLKWFVEAFLAPSIPKYVGRKAKEIALDATAYPTWAKVIEFTRQSDIDSGRIPAQPFHIGADGKVIRCKDLAARTGRRTGTSFYPSGFFTGYFLTTATITRPVTWSGNPHNAHVGEHLPPYILGLSVDPASHNPGPIGVGVYNQARRNAPNLAVVKADPAYTVKPSFLRPLRQAGWDIVMAQPKDVTARTRIITAGRDGTILIEHCGTFLSTWTPQHLRTPPDWLTGKDLCDWYSERGKWRWSVVGREAGGAIRFRCPQCAGRVLTTAKTRNPTATSRNTRNRLPIQAAPDTEYCCDGTVVVRLENLDNHQRCPYGSWAWKTDYSGRNPSENSNSMLKDRGGLDKRSCRAFGLAAHTIAALMLTVIHNLQQTERAKATNTETAPGTDPTGSSDTEDPPTEPGNSPPHPASNWAPPP